MLGGAPRLSASPGNPSCQVADPLSQEFVDGTTEKGQRKLLESHMRAREWFFRVVSVSRLVVLSYQSLFLERLRTTQNQSRSKD
jgi:hypothetical protein